MGIAVIKVDVDQADELTEEFNIVCMPTFVVVKGSCSNKLLNKSGGTEAVVNSIFALAKSSK